jgi:hypothetical protein
MLIFRVMGVGSCRQTWALAAGFGTFTFLDRGVVDIRDLLGAVADDQYAAV